LEWVISHVTFMASWTVVLTQNIPTTVRILQKTIRNTFLLLFVCKELYYKQGKKD
jgi:hypothetical protein